MENLITIETVPIKIEFVEKEQLNVSSVHNSQIEVCNESGDKQIQSNRIRIAVQDSYEPSQSYNWENSTYTATSNVDDEGNLQLNISMEDGEAKSIRFKQINRSIESISNQVNKIETGDMKISIPINRLSSGSIASADTNTEFMPPDLELVVTQRADVIIKYVGGPIYVPRSSDPNYVPLIGFEQNQAIAETSEILNERI